MNAYTVKWLVYGHYIFKHMYVMTAIKRIKRQRKMSKEWLEALFLITYVTLIVGNYIRITI